MTLTLVRLAFAGIRARLLATALTVMITAAAAATLVIALEVRASGVDPWQRTFSAAHGAHVLAAVPSLADARTVAALPGVAERDDPIPSMTTTAVAGGTDVPMQFAGLDGRPRINAPVATAGGLLPGSGIVLERSFAKALSLAIGTTIEVPAPGGPVRLTVVGTAISPSQARYPRWNPGLGWVNRDTLQRIQPDRARWHWTQPVRLTDAASAATFVDVAATALPASERQSGQINMITWQEQRDEALLDSQPTALVLSMFTVLLLIVVFAVVGILGAARAAAQFREIGLLKAVGLTPRQVSAVFVVETAVSGLAAVIIGFAIGAILAPRLAAPSAQTLLGSPRIAADPWHALLASSVVLPVLLISAFLTTRRSTRFTTLHTIQTGAARPAVIGRLGRAVGHLPLPLSATLGLKDLVARGRRTWWTAVAVAVTGAVIVVTMLMRAALRPTAGGVSDVPTELSSLVYTLDAVLVLITCTTLVAVSVLSIRERIRDVGVLKAIGLTPGQITASLVSAQVVLATLAALVSIPVGVGLYLALLRIARGSADNPILAPWWWLAVVPVAVPIAVAVTTTLPARLAAHVPVAGAVRYE